MKHESQGNVIERRQDNDSQATCGIEENCQESPESISEEAKARFWSKVESGDSEKCWNWKASTTIHGYGQFKYKGRMLKPHRVAWTLTFGIIPIGLLACHTCDNRKCCNPSHIFIGTHADNSRDMSIKGRCNSPTGARNGHYTKPDSYAKGEAHKNSKLTAAKVIEMRSLYASGEATQIALAARYGIAFQSVSDIIKRKWWKHV